MEKARKIILSVVAVAVAGIGAYNLISQKLATPVQIALVAVTVPELSAEEKTGEKKYNRLCASCHGANAAGSDGIGPPFIHRIYEQNHHSNVAFFAAAQNGVIAHHWPFGNMPAQPAANESDIRDIVVYIRALQRANGIE